ncbi:MAG: flagellar biosynthetic protein FliO [Spirochaetales bacterium]
MKIRTLFAVLLLASATLVAQTPKPAATPAPATAATVVAPDEKALGITGGDTTAADPAANTGTPAAAANTAQPSGDVTIWDYVKMVFLLVLVIGMILGVVWFLRKISGQGSLVESPIKVLHNHTLAGNRALLLIEVGNEILLVGSAEGSVNLVKQITDAETVDALRLAASEKKAVPLQGSFAAIIGTMLGQREKIRPKIDEPVENSTDFIKKQRERLKNL